MKKFLYFTFTEVLKENNFTSYPNQFISKKQKIRYLCTISSGQDSIATFFLLVHINKKQRLQLLYCNHFWQIKNFFSARSLFHISYLFKAPYSLVLAENHFLTENESRDWRKNNFSRFSLIENIPIVLTGHTETDTLERNLSNILRGTSPGGFSKYPTLNYTKKAGSFFPTKKNIMILLLSFENTLKFFATEKIPCKKLNWFFIKRNKLKVFQKNFHFVIKKQSPASRLSRLKNLKDKNLLFGQPIYKKSNKNFLYPSKQPKIILKLKKPDFYFFTSTKELISKNKDIKFFNLETISYSFCFSNEFYNSNIIIFKPLENIRRGTISKLIKFYKFPVIIDVTNFSGEFGRNKIRHQLIPFSRVLVNPNIEYLLITFFRMIEEQNNLNEKKFKQLEILYKILLFDSLSKSKKNSKFTYKKPLREKIFDVEKRYLLQNFFFEYKNVNLNCSHKAPKF